MATHFRILAWEFPWTEEPGRLQSMGSQRVVHNLVTKQQQQINSYSNYIKVIFSQQIDLGYLWKLGSTRSWLAWLWEKPSEIPISNWLLFSIHLRPLTRPGPVFKSDLVYTHTQSSFQIRPSPAPAVTINSFYGTLDWGKGLNQQTTKNGNWGLIAYKWRIAAATIHAQCRIWGTIPNEQGMAD